MDKLSLCLFLCFSLFLLNVVSESCTVSNRVDCGYDGINEAQCEARSCCWAPQQNSPYCFYSAGTAPQWTVQSLNQISASQYQLFLSINNQQGNYGSQPAKLQVDVFLQSNDGVRIKITDPSTQRWEIPSTIIPLQSAQRITTVNYNLNFSPVNSAFSVSIVRKSDNVTIFQSADLQFSDQYLVISNIYPSLNNYNPNIYGLGEHVDPVRLQTNGHSYTLWNFDTPTPVDTNLYGSHPFYLQIYNNGNAHGMYLHNSNGMDVFAGQDRVTYKTIGGVLDFFIFSGPTPEAVVQQYHALIGLPHFPPYWALGWHQCRYGYASLEEVQQVVANYSAAKIPLDTMWNDIDYMDKYEDFSFDPVNYPPQKMAQFVQTLHNNGQHYVVIVDPGIHNRSGYAPFDDGLKRKIFISEADGVTPVIGKVWPGYTAFPDFSNPAAAQYWQDYIGEFLQTVAIDGLWIDMNEVSNFLNGAATSNSKYNSPPYGINNQNSAQWNPLNTKTLSMDSLHYNGVPEYNIHNMYGLTEAIATNSALENIRGKRSFVLSRSTFPSAGAHTAHWLGDNHATFFDLAASISGILNFNMFGIPLVGADICGFLENTTEELCNRWQALGAFYPFARNHNTVGAMPQEPYRWASVAQTARKTLAARYSLLPYLYTQFFHVNQNGGTVAKPVFFQFPSDTNTWGINTQYFLGPALLINPVTTQGASTVSAYFPPKANFYDYWSAAPFVGSGWQTLNSPVGDIRVYVQGGNIIPTQLPGLTTSQTRLNQFFLIVAPDNHGSAQGNLFWDNGEDLDIGKNALYLSYAAQGGIISSAVLGDNFSGNVPTLGQIEIWGQASQPSGVQVNGTNWPQWSYNSATHVLTLTQLNLSMQQPFKVTYS
jgi:alpha-glucosidase